MSQKFKRWDQISFLQNVISYWKPLEIEKECYTPSSIFGHEAKSFDPDYLFTRNLYLIIIAFFLSNLNILEGNRQSERKMFFCKMESLKVLDIFSPHGCRKSSTKLKDWIKSIAIVTSIFRNCVYSK